jgi:hypothetical protein
MKNGGIILVALAIMFTGIYIYSYSFEYFQKLREIRKLKRQLKKDALIDEHKAFAEKARMEKYEKISQRSKEIHEELKRLSEFRDELKERQKMKNLIHE